MNKEFFLFIAALMRMSSLLAQDWQTDFEQAKKEATNEQKPIILVFQGSDWCAPCIKLDQEIWSTDTFKKYAQEHYIMLLANFPRKKKNSLSDDQTKANAKLAETYNKHGLFPFVVVLDYNGKVLGETGYKNIDPKEYINELNAFIE